MNITGLAYGPTAKCIQPVFCFPNNHFKSSANFSVGTLRGGEGITKLQQEVHRSDVKFLVSFSAFFAHFVIQKFRKSCTNSRE
jgi:hypothetical protein